MAFHFVADQQQQQQFVYASSYEMITIVGTSHGPLLRTFSWAFLSTFKPQNNFSSLLLGQLLIKPTWFDQYFFALAPDDILDRRPHTDPTLNWTQYWGSHTFITIHIFKNRGIQFYIKDKGKSSHRHVCLAFDIYFWCILALRAQQILEQK